MDKMHGPFYAISEIILIMGWDSGAEPGLGQAGSLQFGLIVSHPMGSIVYNPEDFFPLFW